MITLGDGSVSLYPTIDVYKGNRYSEIFEKKEEDKQTIRASLKKIKYYITEEGTDNKYNSSKDSYKIKFIKRLKRILLLIKCILDKNINCDIEEEDTRMIEDSLEVIPENCKYFF